MRPNLLFLSLLMLLIGKAFAMPAQEVNPTDTALMNELNTYRSSLDPQMKTDIEMFNALLEQGTWPAIQKGYIEGCHKYKMSQEQCNAKLAYVKPRFVAYMNLKTPVEVIKKMPKCMPDITDQQFCTTMLEEVNKVYAGYVAYEESQSAEGTNK